MPQLCSPAVAVALRTDITTDAIVSLSPGELDQPFSIGYQALRHRPCVVAASPLRLAVALEFFSIRHFWHSFLPQIMLGALARATRVFFLRARETQGKFSLVRANSFRISARCSRFHVRCWGSTTRSFAQQSVAYLCRLKFAFCALSAHRWTARRPRTTSGHVSSSSANGIAGVYASESIGVRLITHLCPPFWLVSLGYYLTRAAFVQLAQVHRAWSFRY